MVDLKKLSTNVSIDHKSNRLFNHGDQTIHYQCYYVKRSSEVNNIEFYCYTKHGKDIVVVNDRDCLKERKYVVGSVGELEDFEHIEISTQEQVINAWATGQVWF